MNFVMHGQFWKQLGTNDHHDKTMCHEQDLSLYIKDLGHSLHLNCVDRFQWNLFASANNLVIYFGIYK